MQIVKGPNFDRVTMGILQQLYEKSSCHFFSVVVTVNGHKTNVYKLRTTCTYKETLSSSHAWGSISYIW